MEDSPVASLIIGGDDDDSLQDRSFAAVMTNTTSQRIKAVRPEVINALSFLSVIATLYDEQEYSLIKAVFILTGICILAIDCYFIHCQWNLKTSHAIPVLCTGIVSRRIGALDDLLSDLPQSIWVLCYLLTFKFSLIAMVCALHSSFSMLEGMYRLRD